MKNFSMQSFTLLTLMTAAVMGYTVPPHHHNDTKEIHLLRQIHEKAEYLLTLELNKTVMYKAGHGKTCGGKFFCLAEKSLTRILHPHDELSDKLRPLIHALKAYTKKTGEVNCTLETDEELALKKLVQDINECSKVIT